MRYITCHKLSDKNITNDANDVTNDARYYEISNIIMTCALVTHISLDYTTYVLSKYCVLTKNRLSCHVFSENNQKS